MLSHALNTRRKGSNDMLHCGTIAITFPSQHPGRDSEGPCLVRGDNQILGRDDRCVVIANAVFMVSCSWRQQARMRRSRRLFADPLSTNNMKDASCSLISWHSTSPSSLKYFWHQKGWLVFSVTASLCVPAAWATAPGITMKGRVGEVPRCCPG